MVAAIQLPRRTQRATRLPDPGAPLYFVPDSSPILRRECEPVRDIRKQVRPYTDAMLRLLYEQRGDALAIAAPQVGIPLRFFVTAHAQLPFAINPRIVKRAGEVIFMGEGCLSKPGFSTIVARHEHVGFEWTDLHGQKRISALTGTLARVVQHECDHLDGVLIWETHKESPQ